MKKTSSKHTAALDHILHEVGLREMDEGTSTADDRRWAADVAASMKGRVAEHRRSQLAASVPIKKAPPLSQRLLAMPRAALESLFASLVEQQGAKIQFAHRQLDTLSDNDLRRMIQTIETHTDRR